MGLSYNPSSLNSNKTILQAIEELKKYLMNNPLACIYQVPGNVQIDTASLYLTAITIPTGQEIKPGDMVIAMNGYYNFVDSVSETNVYFSTDWCNLGLDVKSITLTFDSTYGEVVDTPVNFTAWIYRRFPRTSDRYYRGRTYYLVITYKDSTLFPSTQQTSVKIPANYLNAIWYQLNVDNSTTIYFDFTEDPEQAEYQLTSFTIPAGQDGTNGTDGVSITGATIDASNHLILTLSDGNTIDAGALPVASGFSNYVEINTTSGTFTNDEYAKLGFNDSVIVYDNGTYKTIYKKKIETSSIIEFESIDASARQNLKLIDVNKGTKAFSSTGVSMITSSTFDSGNATSGKVLTANGSGGTSWETAGGGDTLYMHNFIATGTWTISGKTYEIKSYFSLVLKNSSSVPFGTLINLWYPNNQNKPITATGIIYNSTDNESYLITQFDMASSILKISYCKLTDGSSSYITTSTSLSFSDIVHEIKTL